MRNKNKKIYVFALIMSITLGLFVCVPPHITKAAGEPNVTSEGVTLMDSNTGQVLFSKNGDKQFFPASTTKIVTALIVLENAKLDDKVTVGSNPPHADGTAIGLKEGEIFTVKELLMGLLMESGNDCAEALAEHVSGSKEEFAKLMNKRAKELGCKNTNFTNPSGLPDPNHVTTSNDLSLIMKEAIKNQDFIDIDRTTSLQLPVSNLGQQRWLNNHNYIIQQNSKSYYYPGAIASKKGYTIDAKFTNVLYANRDNQGYIVTCLRGENINTVYADTKNVLDYAYNNFDRVRLYSEGDVIKYVDIDEGLQVPLVVGNDVYYTVKKGSENTPVNKSVDVKDVELSHRALTRGEKVTTGTVKIDNNNIEDIDIVSGMTREYNTKIEIDNFFTKYKTPIYIAIGAAALVLFIKINKARTRRKRKKKKFNK